MRRKKLISYSIVMLIILVTMVSCVNDKGQSAKKVEGLEKFGKIYTVTREEGSGTRGVFAEKVGLENKKNSSNSDNIRKDAKVAMNAEAVVQIVANDEKAIGYVSLGSIKENNKGIKVLAINNVDPDKNTISNGKYPLARNFNIAYNGKITAVEKDFLTYIMGAGQKIISENYTVINGTSTFLSDRSVGMIVISGSSSVAPLMEVLAKDYNERFNKNAKIQIQMTDSTAGLTAAIQGSSDWAMASRELKDYEKELLTYKTIAKDGVAVIVNVSNPVTTLTIEQLKQIFDGTDQSWNDINK